jgi:uncharacterized protein DUF4118
LFDFNPRVAYYIPLPPSILISAVYFGFGSSLFTLIASIAAADFFFAAPVFDFAIMEWEDVATFAIPLDHSHHRRAVRVRDPDPFPRWSRSVEDHRGAMIY